MANEEEVYETVMKKTEAPSRANAKNKPKVRIAKLTRRTYDALKQVIKDDIVDRTFDKYNRKYGKMKQALNKANDAINNESSVSVVTRNLDIVDSYSKRLSKYAVRLLDAEIDEIVSAKLEMGKGHAPKALRVPRIIRRTCGKLIDAILEKRDAYKEKKIAKDIKKDIKKNTREYIENSIERSLFNKDGEAKGSIDTEVFKNLKLDKEISDFDDRMAEISKLRKFISEDGKKPITDNPPVNPTSMGDDNEQKQGEKRKPINEDDLLGKDKKTVSEDENKKEDNSVTEENKGEQQKSQKRLTADDILKGLNPAKAVEVSSNKKEDIDSKKETVEEKTSEKTDNANALNENRKNEFSAINSLIEELKAKEITNPETKKLIEEFISEINKIVDKSVSDEKKEEKVESKKESSVENEKIKAIEDGVKEESKGYVLTDATPNRVQQNSDVSSIKVGPEDIENLRKQKENYYVLIGEKDVKERQLIQDIENKRVFLEESKALLAAQRSYEEKANKVSALEATDANLDDEIAAVQSQLGRKI